MRAIAMMLLALPEGGFFDRPGVDFWGTKNPRAGPPAWTDPGHVPAEPVVRLLEHPTRENAEAYLRWQEDRLAKLAAAVRAIEQARRGSGPAPILYFAQPGCPFCARQDEELAGADLGGRAVRRIEPGEEPHLWRSYGVTATPTLVIDGVALGGVVARDRIEREVRR